jgi:hypothetical protein
MVLARYNRTVHYIKDRVPYYLYQYLWQPYNMFCESTQKQENLFLNKLTFSERVSTIMLGDSRRHMRPGALGFAAGRCVKAAFSLARRHSLIGGAIGGRFWGGQWNTLVVEVHHFGCDGHGG